MLFLLAKLILRKITHVRIFGYRKIFYLLPVVLFTFILWVTSWRLAELTGRALMPPGPPDQNLDHFRRNRSLAHYMENIQVLIEPSSTPCATLDEVPVLVLVTSSPQRLLHREAVRDTWGKYLPTYFVLGLVGDSLDDDYLVNSYIEAKQYGDMIVWDFHDHYQNLTLKTALMMKWTLQRCPQAQFLFKTDDDVLVNPWVIRQVLKDNEDAKLIGYSINDTYLHRDEYTKWYLPRWLHAEDLVSSYLSGTGYMINVEYLNIILKKAYKTPLVNMEDIYFTYIICQKGLKFSLTHDRRLNPHRPWLTFPCTYWTLASAHSFAPEEMRGAFTKIQKLAEGKEVEEVCQMFGEYLASDWLLY